MVMIWTLFGFLLAIPGIVLYRKGRKVIGGLLVLIGGALVLLGVVALLSFHP